MPKLKHGVPKLCRHSSGHAFIKLDGQQVWLGPHDAIDVNERYDRTIAEWLAHGRRWPPPTAASEMDAAWCTNRLIARYWAAVKQRTTANNANTIRQALKIVHRLYGSTAAADFDSLKLEVCRDQMIRKGWCRGHIARQVREIRNMFKWGVSQKRIRAEKLIELDTLLPLTPQQAHDNPGVEPVGRQQVRAVRRYLSRHVRAVIDIQRLSGARAGEIVVMRKRDLDRSRDVWVYKPIEHKTRHRRKDRTIYFGPRSPKILAMFLDRDDDDFLFSPREAERQRHDRAAGHRHPDQKPNSRKTERTLGDHYTTESLRRVIHRACDKAWPAAPALSEEDRKKWQAERRWSPHQLRHAAGTRSAGSSASKPPAPFWTIPRSR